MTNGYVVVDTETTGLTPRNNRIIEIAAVGLRADGSVEGEWSTLLNPDRDLGRSDIHQITARDILYAPRFADVAGDLVELLRGRVIVGHNVRFDAGFVEAEYRRAGYAEATVPYDACLCTMRLSAQVMPAANRTLATCCAQVGVVNEAAHSALADARATAALFQRLAHAYGGFAACGSRFGLEQRLAAVILPPLAHRGVNCVRRGGPRPQDVPFWSRLAAKLPPVTGPEEHNQYLALLDRALIDRVVSSREADELVQLAADLGIDQATANRLNADYLAALARAALADSQVTEAEFRDLTTVAELLDLGGDKVRLALDQAWRDLLQTAALGQPTPAAGPAPSVFRLHSGDMVVFTGQTSRPRDALERLAADAGLIAHPSVTKKVAVVVAADPDSLSGKARKAADYGIPIITESAFMRLLGELP
ncbi:MAG: 3'-5' exoribonuclease [Bifidobacteriaceae bacterium]|jgi:DNA polymerase-3 subunit epsilon|nr:3'-5' exoribonuclease [Bifidobacteriaceae bacterium]